MAITNLHSDWTVAQKQRLPWKKTATRTTVALGWFSLFDVAGNPGAGTLAAGNTANNRRLAANTTEYFGAEGGHKIAVITNT